MIRAEVDAKRALSSIDAVRRQTPFATARALSMTAQVAANAVTRQLPSIFDRPTPFTRKAIAVRPATKARQEALVFVKDRQAEYLTVQETGGVRKPEPPKHGGIGKGKALVMPRAIRRNAFGNMARRALAQAKRRKDTFVGKTAGGTGGFFRRLASGALQPLAIFIQAARYKPRFQFRERTVKVAARVYPAAFREALAKALATARR